MPYIVRSKMTGRYLVRGKDDWEMYWSENPDDATQFKTAVEVTFYLSGWKIDMVDILDPSEIKELQYSDIQTSIAPLTLGDLAEGKKFELVPDSVITFMKVLQPTDKLSDWEDHLDGRYYLPKVISNHSDICWIIVLTNDSDQDEPESRVGRIFAMNSEALVHILQ